VQAEVVGVAGFEAGPARAVEVLPRVDARGGDVAAVEAGDWVAGAAGAGGGGGEGEGKKGREEEGAGCEEVGCEGRHGGWVWRWVLVGWDWTWEDVVGGGGD
jgi:hypothetical protein